MTTRAIRATRAAEQTATWRRWVLRWERSGLSCAAFAAREGLRAATLGWWRWALRRSAESAPAQTPISFVEIDAVAASPGGEGLELVLRTGLVVRVPPGFDADTLRRVLDVAEVA